MNRYVPLGVRNSVALYVKTVLVVLCFNISSSLKVANMPTVQVFERLFEVLHYWESVLEDFIPGCRLVACVITN
jgi:hypothetical protein